MGSCNNLQEGRTEIICLAEGPDRAYQGSLAMTEPDLTQSKRILSFDRRSSFFVLPSSSSEPRRAQYGLLRPSCCSHHRLPARSRSVLIGNFFQ